MRLPKIKFKRKKPTYVKFGEDLDFFGLFERLEKRFHDCYLLESLGDEGEKGRYSIMGFAPELVITAKKNRLTLATDNGRAGKSRAQSRSFQVENPYLALQEMTPRDVVTHLYAGGLVGYLGYDCINYFEPTVKASLHPKFPQFRFGVYKDGLVLDKLTGEIFYFFFDENRFALIEEVKKELTKEQGGKLQVELLGDTKTQAQHRQMVRQTLAEIRAGNIFQGVIGFKTEFRLRGDKILAYAALRKANPSPYMYYLKFGPEVIIGASPELLFQMREGEMETFPLAGTAPRDARAAEDQALRRKLLADPKERAEHSMLIDLHRNDLGRVAKFGTVKVRSLMDVKKFSHVQHISSEVVGTIREDEDMFSALAASFPAGTLSGAPKIEAMRIIERVEGEPRGPYGGALGHFGFNGDCTFAIPIRSLFCQGNYGFAQTSGGIVYDSEPDKEYKELEYKLAAMKKVLNKFN